MRRGVLSWRFTTNKGFCSVVLNDMNTLQFPLVWTFLTLPLIRPTIRFCNDLTHRCNPLHNVLPFWFPLLYFIQFKLIGNRNFSSYWLPVPALNLWSVFGWCYFFVFFFFALRVCKSRVYTRIIDGFFRHLNAISTKNVKWT